MKRTQRASSFSASAVVVVALVGGIYLTAKGITVPPWLATILALVGTGAGWLTLSPLQSK